MSNQLMISAEQKIRSEHRGRLTAGNSGARLRDRDDQLSTLR